MSVKDKIEKAAWSLVENIRDTTLNTIMTAVSSKRLDIKQEELQKLLVIVGTSIVNGFHAGFRTFERSVGELLKSLDDDKSVKTSKKN